MRGAGGLQVGAALVGRFETEVAAGRDAVAAAMGLAMTDVARELVAKLRQDMAVSRLAKGAALQTIWSVDFYGVRERSLEPAAWVYSRFPLIQQAFEDAPTIRARDGKYLLMPNPDVWPGGRIRRPRGARAANFRGSIDAAERRFGPLQFVKLKSGNGILVAQARESRTVAGTFRKASASALTRAAAGKASGLATIVVFFLVKTARLPRLLHGEVIRRRAQASLPGDLSAAFQRRFAAGVSAGPLRLTGPEAS